LEIIKKHLVNPGSKTFVIEGAEHTYLGFYQQVSRLIVDWIKEIL